YSGGDQESPKAGTGQPVRSCPPSKRVKGFHQSVGTRRETPCRPVPQAAFTHRAQRTRLNSLTNASTRERKCSGCGDIQHSPFCTLHCKVAALQGSASLLSLRLSRELFALRCG